MTYDVIVIGAGVSGLYQLHRLRERGFTAHVYEAGDDIGGTWYWNRYPGARFDSESYSYAYSFSPELLAEWDWTEHFSPQPETLRYLRYVVDRFDLRADITCGVRVEAATFDASTRQWTVELDDGSTASARFLVAAVGILSSPNLPTFPGVDDFEGPSFHTSSWPSDGVDLTGKRVAVVGTGATAVQLIPEVAKVAGHLTVFQRTPNWCAPLHNREITEEEQAEIRATQTEIFERCLSTFGGFIHDADRRKALEVSDEVRETFYEKLYGEPGFGIWMGNFRDLLVDPEANATISEFIARKIRERVHDPDVAELLIPRDHGFGTRRVPMETQYFEVYNQPNVELVDLRESPIERITTTGVQTTSTHYDADVIIYATGFDAITGSFERIAIRGEDGQLLRDVWAGGPATYLGLQVAGFPNLFAIVGPQNAAAFCNMTRCIELNVDWVTDLIDHMARNGHTYVAPTREAQDAWVEEVKVLADRLLFTKVSSWFTGRHRPGDDGTPRPTLLYVGGVPAYRDRCAEVAAAGYAGFVLE
jgi:cation diffusion facilitator CzcD-associated flavoprotein CzcO